MTDEAKGEDTPQTEPVESTAEATTATEDAPAEEKEAESSKLHQTVDLKDIGPCKKHVKVTIERADLDKIFESKFTELVTDANVPGFRPGKAPRRIIERRFQKDVTQQVRGEILLQSLQQLAEDNTIAALSAPNIDPSKIEIPKDGPFIYEFDVEVRPEFDLPDYKGLKLKRPMKTFTDEDVAREERRLLEPYGQLVPKESSGEATVAEGDFVIADISSMIGDRLLGELKEIRIRVDERLALKDGVAENFAGKMKGAKAGEKRLVDIVLSDNVADPTLRGQNVQATFDIKDVKTLRLPELTHELCHEFGVHSAEQLRELLRVVLQRRLLYTQRQSARSQVFGLLASTTALQLPQDMLARQARTAMARQVMEMRSSGMAEDEINTRQRMLQRDVLQSTAQALKEHFVLQKIAEQEKIEVGEENIDSEIDRIAEQTDESPRRVRARLEKEDLLDALAADILERKALDFVFEYAEYEEVPLDKEEPSVATVEEQTVPGELQDPTAVPEEEAKTEDANPQAESPPRS